MRECQNCKICFADEVETCPTDGMPTMHTISGEPVLEGKYHLESRIGQGGMGVVYKAQHAYLKTQHAIKVILPDLVGNDPQLVTRFRQEAMASAAIRHPNVVAVTDYGVAQGTMPFLVMEFIEGESLHDLLEREKKLPPEKAFELVSAICAGIGAAHHQGIVHRDMKPLNIMLLTDRDSLGESVKVLDFGLAKIKSGELLGSFIQAQTTGLMGSPYYMAPEQWSDEDLGAQSDIYSIGVMLFQILTGEVPFKASSIPAIMKKHLTDSPPKFVDLNVDLSLNIERVVHHSLEKNAEDRTKTVEDLVEELRQAIYASDKNTYEDDSDSKQHSTLKILTKPAQAKVYINNSEVGVSKEDGWLLVEGIKSGNHKLRVCRSGFVDWEENIVTDGQPHQVVVRLIEQNQDSSQKDNNLERTPKSIYSESDGVGIGEESLNTSQVGMNQTIHQKSHNTGKDVLRQQNKLPSQGNKNNFSPIIFGIIGISGLLILTAIGGIVAYQFGLFSLEDSRNSSEQGETLESRNDSDSLPVEGVKIEMVLISGGEFTMGRNDGTDIEKPEHKITVGDFWIDKTEVTNEEYYRFVTETSYKVKPLDWVGEDSKPVKGKEKHPVRFVNFEDIESFIKWRSKRDNKNYRLPTEEEWEYVARNGDQNNLYPWGDKYRKECAVVGKSTATPEPVGSIECSASTKWGVFDLVGNVFEWTSSKAKAYPGSDIEIINNAKNDTLYMIRGGSAFRDAAGEIAETSTFRATVPSKYRDNRVGFRLIRTQ